MFAYERRDLASSTSRPTKLVSARGRIEGPAAGHGPIAMELAPRRGSSSDAQQQARKPGLFLIERERAGQKRERFALRCAAVAALERADSIRAHVSPFSEGFLREAGREPVVPEEPPEAG